MPWTVSDVKRFTKKADTDKKKRLWVRIANGALSKGDMEATAIRKANAAIAKI